MHRYNGLILAVAATVLHVSSAANSEPLGIPGRFIVEFKAGHLAARDASSNNTAVDELISDLASVEVGAAPIANYTSELFAGASIKVANDTSSSVIEALPQVERVWPVYEMSVPTLFDSTLATDSLPPYNPHLQTGVDKLHKEGINGAGSIVAVIDTGVDHTHPALGGGYGPGFKIEGGYDFVGDGFDPQEDNDPYDGTNGHGTHVTGIIAGVSERFIGVAPQARIRVYKIVGDFIGTITTDVLVQANLKAYEDGADIISTSIGNEKGWPYGAWEETSERIARQGVIVVNAAGNSGRSGPQVISGGAVPEHVVGVASTDSDQLPGIAAVVQGGNGTTENVPYLTLDGIAWPATWAPTKTGMPLHSPLQPGGEPGLNTACGTLPFDEWTDELRDQVVLLRRSSNCSFLEQARAALSRGSQSTLFINDDSAPAIPDVSAGQMTAGLLTRAAGESLEKRLIAGENITIKFPDFGPAYNFEENFVAPQVSDYSSWGLGNDASLKPNIAAPGGRILSTWPQTLGSYFIASGTSMATPYIAGVAALYLSAHGGRAALGVEGTLALAASLSSAGNPVFWNNGTTDITSLAPAQQQGGGQIDAYRFVHSTTQVTPNRIHFNHTGTGAIRTPFEITIKNNGPIPVTYEITHRPSPSIYTYPEQSDDWASESPTALIRDADAEIKFEVANITVQAGASQVLPFQFAVPVGLVETRLPIFTGFISLAGSNGDTISIPYGAYDTYLFVPFSKYILITDIKGMAADGRNIQPFTSAGALWLDGSTTDEITQETEITLAGGGELIATVSLRYGSERWRVEVIEADAPLDQLEYPGAPGQDGLVGVIIEPEPLGRNIQGLRWGFGLSDSFNNGTQIPAGRWRYVSRVLKPFWSPDEKEAWEVRASPIINVRRG